jgi:RNA polymerase sigma factor (sigma-70 family)
MPLHAAFLKLAAATAVYWKGWQGCNNCQDRPLRTNGMTPRTRGGGYDAMSTSPDTAHLLAGLAARDPAAIEELVRRYKAQICVHIAIQLRPRGQRRRAPASAAETSSPEVNSIFHSVVVRVLERLAKGPLRDGDHSNLGGLLCVIATHSVVDRARRMKREISGQMDALAAVPDPRQRRSEEDMTADRLLAQQYLDRLTNDERTLVVLHLEGSTFKELAEHFGRKEHQLRAWYNRILTRLRRLTQGVDRA